MAVTLRIALLAAAVAAGPALAQDAKVAPPPPAATPAPEAKPDAKSDSKPKPDAAPDVWIFSGNLLGSHESYSGTLVSGKDDAQFELKLAAGATCDGSELKGEVGLVRLSEIACSDGRKMRALFVPQNGSELKVFGHVGEERFTTSAHLLGTEPVPEKKQTTQPTVPQVQPPGPPPGVTPAPTPDAK